jgi:hypothetical protein
MIHRTVFGRRKHHVEHPRAVKLHQKHILVEFQIMSDYFSAPIRRTFKVKERDLNRDSAGA